MDVSYLPAVNATLNGVCTILLLAGLTLIKQRKTEAHKRVMFSAGFVSALFLTSYLIYHWQAGSVKFQGTGAPRVVYFAILISHVLLAASIAVLVPMTFWRAHKEQWDRHRKLAKITFPIWLYVSITGVVIYVMLYHLYAAA